MIFTLQLFFTRPLQDETSATTATAKSHCAHEDAARDVCSVETVSDACVVQQSAVCCSSWERPPPRGVSFAQRSPHDVRGPVRVSHVVRVPLLKRISTRKWRIPEKDTYTYIHTCGSIASPPETLSCPRGQMLAPDFLTEKPPDSTGLGLSRWTRGGGEAADLARGGSQRQRRGVLLGVALGRRSGRGSKRNSCPTLAWGVTL